MASTIGKGNNPPASGIFSSAGRTRWLSVSFAPLASVALTTAIGLLVSDVAPMTNISMLYLAAVIISALAGGGLPAVLAAVLSSLAYNFFFIAPELSFTVARPEELLALLIFLVVALVTGGLAGRLRSQEQAARVQADTTRKLYGFVRSLSGALGLDAVAASIAQDMASISDGRVAVLLGGDGGNLRLASSSPENVDLSADLLRRADRVHEGRETPADATSEDALVLPLRAGMRRLGVIVVKPGRPVLAQDELNYYAALAEQAAVAIDRAHWARQSAEAAIVKESQKLQSTLLSSLSHDLKTPLASITGAATSLLQLGEKMDEATRIDLLQSIAEDAGRLNRFVGNLFDMTRIESGGLKIRRDVLDMGELAERAAARVKALYPELRVDLRLGENLPPARGDALLVEQALFNILDNARKYAGTSRPVAIRAASHDGLLALSVTDDGPGIAASDLERIFDKFYRSTKGDGRPAGTGLGLSIARGFITAMGGGVSAESPVHGRRGARITLALPLAE